MPYLIWIFFNRNHINITHQVFDKKPDRGIASWNTLLYCLQFNLTYHRVVGTWSDEYEDDGDEEEGKCEGEGTQPV